ncbi:unnamed protein product [Closterium sp. Naga37s-1]|nr:unnamed protein product [Closterium sp. Naga37s-1]
MKRAPLCALSQSSPSSPCPAGPPARLPPQSSAAPHPTPPHPSLSSPTFPLQASSPLRSLSELSIFEASSPLRSLSELSVFEVPSWSACLPPSSHPSCTTGQGPEGERREMAEGGKGEEVEVACGEKRGREGGGVAADGGTEGASGKRLRGEERGEEAQGDEEDGVEREEGVGGEKKVERKGESEKGESEKGEKRREGGIITATKREEGEEEKEGEGGNGGKEGERGVGGEEGKEAEERVQMLVVRARAPSFLYHQVRLLVGLLKAVGAGAVQPDTVKSILEARDIRGVPAMAPACGLYLASVAYGHKRPKRGSSQE